MTYLLLTWLCAPLLYLRLAFRRSAAPQRILLIQSAKIGDMVATTPVIRAIRHTWPQAELYVLLSPLTAPLLAHNPHVTACLPFEAGRGLAGRLRLINLLRRYRIDTTVCLSPNLAFLLAPLWAGVSRRLSMLPNFGGASYRAAAPFLSAAEPHRAGRLVLDSAFALLRRLGVETADRRKEVFAAPGAAQKAAAQLPAAPRPPLIGIGLSAGNKLKELGSDKLCALAGLLLERSAASIVLVGSAADRVQGEEILQRLGSARIVNAAGSLTLAELPALLGELSAYVGVDSGVTYMADALDVPLVDIMGPADADDQRPLGPRAVVMRPGVPCAPCSHAFRAPYFCHVGTRACIVGVDPQQVAAEVLKLMAVPGEAR